MKAVTRYEWKYEPQDFFEERIDIRQPGLVINSQNGIITADVDSEIADTPAHTMASLTEQLICVFRGHQFISRKLYSLENPSHTEIDKDGKIHTFLHVETGILRVTGNPVDFIRRGPKGEVLSDTKAERIDRKNKLADLISASKLDPVSDRIVRSYESSITDPRNELIHLYEVRDALKSHFGNSRKAQHTLNISNADWNRLGDLANNKPLAQGRHRGSHDDLREASEEELNEARTITLRMVESYLAREQ